MFANRSRRGFSLIELLVVVVIIGIIAAIAVPKFQSTKGKAFASTLKSDLKNLSSSQEDYFYFNESYSPAVAGLNFTPTDGAVLTIAEATGRGWSATITHPAAAPMVCAVFYGDATPVTPATSEGIVGCQ